MAWLGTPGLTPHGFCLAWDPALLSLHVVSDATIALAYYSIPAALAWLVMHRRDLAFRWIFWLFAMFIMACGTTHVMDVWTLWYPDYLTQGLIKAATAALSIITAFALWPMLPRVLALPSPAMLRDANDRLAAEVRERDRLLAALKHETEERERAEEMLRQAQKMEAIGQLTGGVAHDFNNLLLVMQANLELLDRRLHDDTASRALIERAMQAAGRGGALTQQLLAFSRRQSLRPTRFDVNRLAEQLQPILRGTLSGAVVLDLSLGKGLPEVEADANQLENAILNLVINARDAMPDGGLVRVETSVVELGGGAEGIGPAAVDPPPDLRPGRYVCIAVADTGTGMTPDVQAAAFEPFFTTKPVGQGSGLGLSQVYGFVKQSHGSVSLRSVEGAGTIVSLFLPAAREAALAGDDAAPLLRTAD